MTIKDALEGDYYYCLNVSKTFPEHLKGKLWEIKMKFNEEWFETFPSEKDETGIHDYHLTIPSIRFGVPISEEGKYKGKIFYNLGQAKDMYFTFRLYNEFEIQGIKIIAEEDIDKLREAIGDEENKIKNLLDVWDKIPEQKDITDKINVSFAPHTDPFYNSYTFNLSEAYPLFPYEEAANKPFVTKLNILVKSYSIHAPYGYRNILTSSKVHYNDGRKIKKKEADHSYINIYISGPHFAPTFKHQIVEFDEKTNQYVKANDQDLYKGDSVIIKLTLTATNEGTNTAYQGNFNLKIDKDAQYIKTEQTSESIKITEGGINGDVKIINILYNGPIPSKDYRKFDLYFKVKLGDKDLENTSVEENSRRALDNGKTSQLNIVKGIDMTLCVVENCESEEDPNFGRQKSDVKYNLSYKIDSVNRDNSPVEATETEPEKDDKGLPGYAIALIVILGAAAVATSAFLVYKFLVKKAVENIALSPSENPEIVKSYAGEQSYKKVETSSSRIQKRSIGNKRTLSQFNKDGAK